MNFKNGFRIPCQYHRSAGARILMIAALLSLQACGGGEASPDGPRAEMSALNPPAAVPAQALNIQLNTPTVAPAPTPNILVQAPAPSTQAAAPVTNMEIVPAPAATPNEQVATPAVSSTLVQYTPNPANWSTFSTKPLAAGNTAHDPDGASWITPDQWAASKWDGTIYNPSKMSKAEFAAAICPSVDRVRGIREVFYKHKPFADNRNPTKAEVDEWHRIAVNHVRALIGYTSPERQVQKDHCMFARAQWGNERKFSTQWDAKYPGSYGSAFGPCQGARNAHCGATFIPDLQDQAPYLPAGHSGCGVTQGSEGIFSGPKSNIPWSLKWSRGLCNTLLQEGFWGGHVGPWFHREKFGLGFWDSEPDNNRNNAVLRAKWTGKLMPNLYCNPADPQCDPNKPIALP
jgi:hypothetical protein